MRWLIVSWMERKGSVRAGRSSLNEFVGQLGVSDFVCTEGLVRIGL